MTPEQYAASHPDAKRMKFWRVNVFAATWMSYAGFYFCRKNFGIVKAPLKQTLEINDFQLSWIWTSFLIAYMLGQFLSAWMGRKAASRTLLLLGMGASVVANLLFGGALSWGPNAYGALIVFMVINGFAQATGWPNNVAMIANWTWRPERGTMMAVWATCYQLGSIIAKAFAALMLGWLGLKWSFWGASAVLFGVWILFYFMGKNDPESAGLPALVDPMIEEIEEIHHDDEHPSEPSPQDTDKLDMKILRVIIAMGVIYFCFKFLRYALDSWAPLLLEEKFKTTTTNAGLISTAFDWLGFAGVFFAGVASDKLFKSLRAPIIFWMSVGMLGGTLFFWFVGGTSIVMFTISLGLIGFMLMGPDSLLSGAGAVDVGSRRTAVFAAGMINGLGSIGPIVQEPLIGYLKTNASLNAVMILLVVIAALAVLGTFLLWFHTKRQHIAL